MTTKKEKTLLEKASETPRSAILRNTHIGESARQRAELALAYWRGVVTGQQAADATGTAIRGIGNVMGCALGRGIRLGYIKAEMAK